MSESPVNAWVDHVCYDRGEVLANDGPCVVLPIDFARSLMANMTTPQYVPQHVTEDLEERKNRILLDARTDAKVSLMDQELQNTKETVHALLSMGKYCKLENEMLGYRN